MIKLSVLIKKLINLISEVPYSDGLYIYLNKFEYAF